MFKQIIVLVSVIAVSLVSGTAFAATEFDFSGQIRIRPESRDNADFNDNKNDEKAFIGSRTRIRVKAKVSENAFAKFVIQDSRQWGDASQVENATEKQALDFYEAFFQVNNIADSGLSVKAGRQTLMYGDQRLLGNLGWTDSSRTHDAFKTMYTNGAFNIDLFAAKEAESGRPSDSTSDNDLYGAYSVIKPSENMSLDLYALNWKTSSTKEVDGASVAAKGKNIMTYGARAKAIFGSVDFTAEYAIQRGDWSETVKQEASALAIKAGFKPGFWNSRIGVEYDSGSGGASGDSTNKNFVFPFHTNHAQYGYMDYFSWGNMNDLSFHFKAAPTKRWMFKLAYHIFTLADGKADWLNVVGTKAFLSAVEGKNSTDAGQEVDLTLAYKATKNMKIVGGYSTFLPGEAAKERTGGFNDNSTWGYVMAVFNF